MTCTRGGARAGAGRPQGGISLTRRLLTTAITKGLAHAGKMKYPSQVSSQNIEEAASDTAAMIVSDMIQAGQGNDVIKIWAMVAMKETEGQGNQSKNILANALSRLPRPDHVADMSRNKKPVEESPEFKGLEDNRPTDNKAGGL